MRKLLFVVSLLGLAVSGYLLFAYVSGGPIVCSTHGGCEIVRASEYSEILGVPTPLHGVIFYMLLGIGAALWTKDNERWLKFPLVVLTGIGVAVSAVLTYIEAYVVEAWCIWCVVSAILTVLALLIVWTQRFRSKEDLAQ